MRDLGAWLDGQDGVVEERDGYVVRCPAHADGDPSLRVALRDDALLIHCRAGCAKEDVLAALGWRMRDLFGWAPGSAVRTAAAEGGVPHDAHVAQLGRLVALWEDEWAEAGRDATSVGEAAWRYALERFGLDGEQSRELRLGFAPAGVGGAYTSGKFTEVPRLVVPFLDFDGEPAGLQARDVSGDPDAVRWCGLRNPPRGAWSKLAVMRQPTGLDYTLVTEGPGDALTAYGAGYNAVAVRGAGLAANEGMREELAAGLGAWDGPVIVVGDADAAGVRFQADVSAALVGAGLDVRTLELPAEAGDLNDWRTADPAGFVEALSAAVRAAVPVAAQAGGHEPAAAPGASERPDGARGDVAVALDVLEHEGQLRHSPGLGFLHWSGYSWRVDGGKDSPLTRAAVHRQGQRYAALAAAAPEGSDERKALAGMAHKAQSSRSVDGILKELAALDGVRVADGALDRHKHLLAVRNGTVDLRTGRLQQSDPADLLTAALDVDYRPEALAPAWVRFLHEAACGQEGWVDYLQRLTGYGITGEISEAVFCVHLGNGGNGKSVYAGVLAEVFRNITRVTAFTTFEEQRGGGPTPELAAMRGSRLVMASEGAANNALDEAMVKRVTGGERMEVRQLYKEPATFLPSFLIMLSTNHRPGIKGGDEGIWRRVQLLEWRLRLAKHEQDRELASRIVELEAEGVLAWAVAGAVAWYEEGLAAPACVADATSRFRETSDELAGFMPGLYELDDAAPAVLAKDVLHVYQEWADEEGVRAWGRRALYNALEERGVVRELDARGLLWLRGMGRTDHGGPAGTRVPGVDITSSTQSDYVKEVSNGAGTREPAAPDGSDGPDGDKKVRAFMDQLGGSGD